MSKTHGRGQPPFQHTVIPIRHPPHTIGRSPVAILTQAARLRAIAVLVGTQCGDRDGSRHTVVDTATEKIGTEVDTATKKIGTEVDTAMKNIGTEVSTAMKMIGAEVGEVGPGIASQCDSRGKACAHPSCRKACTQREMGGFCCKKCHCAFSRGKPPHHGRVCHRQDAPAHFIRARPPPPLQPPPEVFRTDSPQLPAWSRHEDNQPIGLLLAESATEDESSEDDRGSDDAVFLDGFDWETIDCPSYDLR